MTHECGSDASSRARGRDFQRGERASAGWWKTSGCASSVGVIGGAPKCAKTWLGLDMALSVATGTACLGKYAVPEPGPVLVYLAEDALPVVRERIEGMARHRGLDLGRVEIHVITAPVLRLDRDRDRTRLRETARQLRPRLLLLDPLVRLHRHRREPRGRSGGAVGVLSRAATRVRSLGHCWCITRARTPPVELPQVRGCEARAIFTRSATRTFICGGPESTWCSRASTGRRRQRRRSIWSWWPRDAKTTHLEVRDSGRFGRSPRRQTAGSRRASARASGARARC